ncbi:MAG: hypothetical protein AAFR31_18165 [Cyanobacteria bacterium J06627_8]
MKDWDTIPASKKLAIRIKMARVAADRGNGITQEELGKRVGELLKQPPFSQKQVHLWEQTGNAPSCTVGAIAEATGFNMQFFSVLESV